MTSFGKGPQRAAFSRARNSLFVELRGFQTILAWNRRPFSVAAIAAPSFAGYGFIATIKVMVMVRAPFAPPTSQGPSQRRALPF